MPAKLENLAVATGLEKVSFHSNPKERQCNIHWIIEKAWEFHKNIYFWFIDYAKAFNCVYHKNCGKFFKIWEYQTTWPAS